MSSASDLRWKDAPSVYGPHKTLYNRFRRWAEKGVFQRIFAALAAERASDGTLIIDPTHIKAHRTAASLLLKKGGHRCLGRTKGGLNAKLHAVCDADDKPLILLLTEGQFSDGKAAFCLLEHLPPGATPIADKAYDSHRLRQALRDRRIRPCIPVRKGQWDDGSFNPRLNADAT